MKIILATASPTRNKCFKQLNLEYEAISTDIDEDQYKGTITDHEQLATTLAKAKAESLAHTKDAIIIGCDTINIRNNIIRGKPKSYEEAFNSIKAISNNVETVYTGLCIINTKTNTTYTDCSVMSISFNEIKDEHIHNYLKQRTKEGKFTASCGFEPDSFFPLKHHKHFEGSTTNLLYGLPIELILPKLREFGIDV